jgi:2-(1,2-epoxy-1,2-dihydrophenyl)acetyl-CoA isomerase
MTALLVSREDGVLTITLNRPERHNAMNLALFDELRDAIEESSRNPQDRVLVITGAGESFSSGGDIRPGDGPRPEPATAMHDYVGAAALAVHRYPKPVIAAVNGQALGAGAVLAFSADIVLASDAARFRLVFVDRGLSVDFGGTWVLPRLVGLQKAKELALYGDWFDAEEAHRIGLVNRVFPAPEFTAGVRDWAGRLGEKSPTAVRLIKQSLNRSWSVSVEAALEIETVAQNVAASSPESIALREAFLSRKRS